MLNLRLLRLVSGLTILDLSQRTGIDMAKISLVERGKIQPGKHELIALARGLGIPTANHESLLAEADPVRLREAVEIGPRE